VISITRVEYCRFSLKGKLRLLDLFGEVVFEKITQKEELVVFKLNDFYVAVIKDMEINSVIDASPLWSEEQLQFYLSQC
jgi:hypothetical protein